MCVCCVCCVLFVLCMLCGFTHLHTHLLCGLLRTLTHPHTHPRTHTDGLDGPVYPRSGSEPGATLTVTRSWSTVTHTIVTHIYTRCIHTHTVTRTVTQTITQTATHTVTHGLTRSQTFTHGHTRSSWSASPFRVRYGSPFLSLPDSSSRTPKFASGTVAKTLEASRTST